jgi:hypothetical protein
MKDAAADLRQHAGLFQYLVELTDNLDIYLRLFDPASQAKPYESANVGNKNCHHFTIYLSLQGRIHRLFALGQRSLLT